jgi:ribosomal protein S18 acetylase RimI-like enzyme
VTIEVRRATSVDDVRATAPVFDHPLDDDGIERFLAAPGHHMFVAWQDGEAIGFVRGSELHHPRSNQHELLLYELGVAEAHRRQGAGRMLVDAFVELARSLRCSEVWVLTDDDNAAALRTYRAAGASAPAPQVLLAWDTS